MHMTTKRDLPGFLCGARVRQGGKTNGVKCTSVFVQRSLIQDAILETLKDWADAIESSAADAQVPPPAPVELESVRLERDLARLDADLARQTDLVSKGVILAVDYVPARERLPAEREAIVQRLEDLLEGVEEPEKRALAPARIVVVPRWADGGVLPVLRVEQRGVEIALVGDEVPPDDGPPPRSSARPATRTSQRAQDLDLTPSRLTREINPKSHRRHPRRRRPPDAATHRPIVPSRLPHGAFS
jgi:hypothetical protein